MVKIRTAEFVLVDVDDTRVESLVEELDVEEARFFCEQQPSLLSISSLSVLARLSPPAEGNNCVMEWDGGGFYLFLPRPFLLGLESKS
jgi:hypothetical protein